LPQNSLPFKGRAGVGMDFNSSYGEKATHPPPHLPLERGGIDTAKI